MSVTKTQTGSQGKGPGSSKPVTTGAGSGANSGSGGLGNRLREYWQTLVYEWRKISWPDRKQWKDSTIVVFVFTIFMMVLLALFDFGVGYVVNKLLGLDRPI